MGSFLVYAVYAISSLDTELSLRHGTQNTAWGFVGQGVAGFTPGPFRWRFLVLSLYQDGALELFPIYLLPSSAHTLARPDI